MQITMSCFPRRGFGRQQKKERLVPGAEGGICRQRCSEGGNGAGVQGRLRGLENGG